MAMEKAILARSGAPASRMRVSFVELNTSAFPEGVCTVVFEKASIVKSSSVSVADELRTLTAVCILEGAFCGVSTFHCMFPAKAVIETEERKNSKANRDEVLVMTYNWIFKK